MDQETRKSIPRYEGNLRSHALHVPEVIRECSGIVIFGRRIKSVVFTTDICIIRNIDADAVMAVYPFTPQPIILQSLLMASNIPIFDEIGGGLTTGARVVNMANSAEIQGASGVVMNAPTNDFVLAAVSKVIEIPSIITVVSDRCNIQRRLDAGADILNVAAGAGTADLVKKIRDDYPDVPIIATGGQTEDSIMRTIEAGANTISWTPPSTASLFKHSMDAYRDEY